MLKILNKKYKIITIKQQEKMETTPLQIGKFTEVYYSNQEKPIKAKILDIIAASYNNNYNGEYIVYLLTTDAKIIKATKSWYTTDSFDPILGEVECYTVIGKLEYQKDILTIR